MAYPNHNKRKIHTYKSIYTENLDDFKREYPKYDTAYHESVINKMLNCGTVEGGYAEYDCMGCGGDKHVVYFSCKSKLCLKCAKRYAAEAAESIASQLIHGVKYRQVVLTIPKQFRDLFYEHHDHGPLYSAFMKVAYECMEEVLRKILKRSNIKIAAINFIHTHSRNGDYKPHLHIILGEGALDLDAEKWLTFKKINLSTLRKTWQKHFLAFASKHFPDEERLIYSMEILYPDGFYAHPGEGFGDRVPSSNSKGLIRYLTAYLASPPISLSRLHGYANGRVYYHYNSHETGQKELETVRPTLFLKRMMQHVMPKGFQRMRYFGLQATSTFKKYLPLITKLIGDLVDMAVNATRKLFYAEMFQKSVDRNPFVCRKCGKGMELSHLSHPDRGGTFFDVFAASQ